MGVDLERDGAVATVVLRSDNGFNVADVETMTRLRAVLAELADDRHVRAVILTGSGERAFCAGADIKYMGELDAPGGLEWGRLGHEVCRLLEGMPKATIAAINGLALGGGCELALACDLRYAASSAKLGQPEINLGLIPGWGGSQRLVRSTGIAFAKELILTGRLVDAHEAVERGFVNAVHDPVLEKAKEIARLVAAKSASSVAAAKRMCNASLQGDLAAKLDDEATAFGRLFGHEGSREGLAAFLERREPDFPGAGD